MLAYGRWRPYWRRRPIAEQWSREWDCGFLSWIPGRTHDDGDVQSRTICVVEVQTKPSGLMFESSYAHTVDIGFSHYGQCPTTVDSHHWFLETLLRHM